MSAARVEDIKPFNWRDHLKVHPAAELFPLMSETDPKALQELAKDIKKNGLRQEIVFDDKDGSLLDGRNRLDTLALLGMLELMLKGKGIRIKGATEPLIAVPYAGGHPFDRVL